MGDLYFQVHHIIPINVFNAFMDDFERIFEKEGVKANVREIIQSYNNRMALFTDDAHANALRNLVVS